MHIEPDRVFHRAVRMAAVDANRGGDLREAGLAMRHAADAVRALAPDDEVVKGCADRLCLEERLFELPMASADHKALRSASYRAAYSRQADGKARKKG